MSDVLTGYTIGVTADRRSSEQIRMLEGRGATCIHGPMLDTHPLVPEREIAEATRHVIANPPDFTILTTGIGVRGWFSAADALLMGDDLRTAVHGSTVFVRGPKAHGAAITAGVDVDWNAPTASLDEVVEELIRRGVDGRRVAVQLDGDPNRSMVERIEAAGATVDPVPVYEWTMPEEPGAARGLVRAVVEHRVDALTFTARPAVTNFMTIAEEMGVEHEVRYIAKTSMIVFAVGPSTAAAVEEAGLGPSEYPESGRLGTMVLQLTERLDGSALEMEIDGHDVSLRGRLLSVGRKAPELLTSRERRLFMVLASRPGVVFSKRALLDTIWKGESVDEHSVEVAIGRLRRRLGEAGVGIETVMRRGYRLSIA